MIHPGLFSSGGIVPGIKRFVTLACASVLGGYAGYALAEDPGFNTGIEGMDSQEWSVGIFIFLIICIIVFTAIVVKFMTGDRVTALKQGEKYLFAWILLGVVAAIIFGALQLLQGRLF